VSKTRAQAIYTVALATMLSGCTFYTSCPTDQGNGTSGSNGKGGSNGNGGSNGSGGSTPGGGTESIITADIKGEWTNVTPDLSGIEQTCGPFFYATSKPDEDELIVNVTASGLWASNDGGDSWRVMGQAESSAKIDNGAGSIVFDPEHPETFWEAGQYGSAGLFRTDDGGDSFERLGDVLHLDAVSVDFSDPDRRTMLITGHERDSVQLSKDGGSTWTEIAEALPDDSKQCRYPHILDTNTFLIGCGGYVDSGKPGTYRSTDGGDSWKQVHDNGGGAEPLITSDGTIYWSEEFGGGLARSDDAGKSFEKIVGAKALLPVRPIELPDGRLASLNESFVVVSKDRGVTWTQVTPTTPWKPVGFTYSPFQKAFFIFYFGCNNAPTPAKGDELQRFDFDYEAE
jgi:hypothetical protein